MTEFIEVKTAELEGAALDWAVALAVDWAAARIQPIITPSKTHYEIHSPSGLQLAPSVDWACCGPLIKKFRVSIIYSDEVCDPCAWTDNTAAWHGKTPLIAACRAIVAAKLGETVRVPVELMQ